MLERTTGSSGNLEGMKEGRGVYVVLLEFTQRLDAGGNPTSHGNPSGM